MIEGKMHEVYYVLRDAFAKHNHYVVNSEDRQSTTHETILAEVNEGDGDDALTGLARRKAKAVGMMDGGNSNKKCFAPADLLSSALGTSDPMQASAAGGAAQADAEGDEFLEDFEGIGGIAVEGGIAHLGAAW